MSFFNKLFGNNKKEEVIDEHEEHDKETKKLILDTIKKYGHFIALLEPDASVPGFAYTVGLYKKYKHPEIICFGLDNELMMNLLNQAGDMIKGGFSFEAGKFYKEFLDGYEVQFLEVDKDYYSDYAGYAAWYNDNKQDFPMLQLVWPDSNHKFPWEEDFNQNLKFRQPMLDRGSDFRFYEERNLSVFTTKQVLDGEPILYAYHNDDGDWQFHSSTNPSFEDAKVVGFEEITKLDPTINKLYDLPYSWRAIRENKNSDWEYEEDDFVDD